MAGARAGCGARGDSLPPLLRPTTCGPATITRDFCGAVGGGVTGGDGGATGSGATAAGRSVRTAGVARSGSTGATGCGAGSRCTTGSCASTRWATGSGASTRWATGSGRGGSATGGVGATTGLTTSGSRASMGGCGAGSGATSGSRRRTTGAGFTASGSRASRVSRVSGGLGGARRTGSGAAVSGPEPSATARRRTIGGGAARSSTGAGASAALSPLERRRSTVPDDSFWVCAGAETEAFSFSRERLMRATSSASSEDMWLFTSRPSARILAMRSLLGIPTSLAISYTRIFAPVILRLDPRTSFYSLCTWKARVQIRGVFRRIRCPAGIVVFV